jgi:putative redox protein
MPKPPTIADVRWERDLVFHAESAGRTMIMDGNSKAGPSPVQTLAFALAGCMSTDVAFVLAKGHYDVRALTAHMVGERAQEDPHRFVRVTLHFAVDASAPREAVARAIELSRDKYCSVWHSLRQDIDFEVTFDTKGAASAG